MELRADTSEHRLSLGSGTLLLFLLAQAGLLFCQLAQLPIWGDEHFTLQTAAQPLGQLFEVLRTDIHPPLYYLFVHFLLGVPWPVSPIIAARAFSVLLALASTVAVDRLWLSTLEQRTRVWFLLLWTFSPCLLLYGRVARSYTLQLFLACIALHLATGLLRDPGSRRRLFLYTATVALLSYTHYLPGIAVALTVTLVSAWRALRLRSPRVLIPALASNLLLGIAYLPWLGELSQAMGHVARAQPYSPVSVAGLGELLKLGYWFFAFNFGETPPLWVIAGSALLAPAVIWLAWQAVRRPPEWIVLVLPFSLIAYIGASRWVSFSFIPARLLYLLPFYLLLLLHGRERRKRAGSVICVGILCLSAGSISSYFRKQDFLNKGYLVPYAEIATLIENRSADENVVVVVDRFNTDPWPLLASVRRGKQVVIVQSGASLESLHDRAMQLNPDTVWYFRNTHDISPGEINRRLEMALAANYETRKHLFVPYSRADRWGMKLLGWKDPPSHYAQLLEMRRR